MDWPPTSVSSIRNIIASYLYVQYADDDDLQGFVAAFNNYTQSYLDYLNNLNLPIYTNGNIADALLDWVATGLYGLPRPGLPTTGTPSRGPFNTYVLNYLPFNGLRPGVTTSYYATTDDIYKRILTWLFYKGDGKVFTVRWLKRRIQRFLTGLNGVDPGVITTYNVSVTFTSPKHATITIPTSTMATIFSAAVAAGILELPFQITWTVTLV